MSINNQTVRSLTSGLSKRDISSSNTDLLSELSDLIDDLRAHLQSSNIEKTGNWLLEQDLWLKNENNNLGGFYNYVRGDIIRSVDLGTSNIGTEIRYPHPCVVLYDNNEDWVLVAPITQASLDSSGNPIVHPPFEILARKNVTPPSSTREFHFTKHSVIQVDQIQRISKHRAVIKSRFKLRQELLNQIDNVILQHIIPLKFNLLNRMKGLITSQEEKIVVLERDNMSLSQDIRRLSQRIEDLTVELEDLKRKSRIG